MKKLLALILASALALSLMACGGGDTSNSGGNSAPPAESQGQDAAEPTPESTPEPTPEPAPEAQTLSFGDTATTEYFEFTPVFEGFADEVANWPDENYLTPNGTFYGSNPFKANEEKTIMWFSGTVNYLGGSTTNETFSYSYRVVYDNDYIFQSGGDSGAGYTSDLASGKWANGESSMTFEPLSSNTTRYIRFCIEVPEQLETDTDKSLVVVFGIDGNEYSYTIR